ncbi:hypothetical protein N7499_011884 [Penicillium canescens]|nr:hypothetical protein N7499_011884 [Penicillium canescens]KAJ6181950.1 hypothetical protein N7485_000592 [Penicillium canescens]
MVNGRLRCALCGTPVVEELKNPAYSEFELTVQFDAWNEASGEDYPGDIVLLPELEYLITDDSAEPDVSDTLHSDEEQSLAALAISGMIFSGRHSRGASAANFNIGAAPEPARFTKEEDLLKWYSGNDTDYAIDGNPCAKQLAEQQAEALKDSLIMNEDTVRQVWTWDFACEMG